MLTEVYRRKLSDQDGNCDNVGFCRKNDAKNARKPLPFNEMRPFKDFCETRLALIKGPDERKLTRTALAEMVGVHRETLGIYINAAKPASGGDSSISATLNAIAVGLKFYGWSDLVDAWENNDLDRHLAEPLAVAKTGARASNSAACEWVPHFGKYIEWMSLLVGDVNALREAAGLSESQMEDLLALPRPDVSPDRITSLNAIAEVLGKVDAAGLVDSFNAVNHRRYLDPSLRLHGNPAGHPSGRGVVNGMTVAYLPPELAALPIENLDIAQRLTEMSRDERAKIANAVGRRIIIEMANSIPGPGKIRFIDDSLERTKTDNNR